MALVDGSPSIRLEGDRKRALALVPEGRLLLQKAQALVARADVPTYSLQRQVSEDEYIYVLCAGAVNVIQISAGVRVPNTVHDRPEPVEPSTYPNFLSGVVFDGTMVAAGTPPKTYNVLKEWVPTPNCARLRELPSGRQPSGRLAVRPHYTQPEWSSAGSKTFTQYEVPRTSEWSGTMKAVVQIIMGLGRIGKSALRDPDSPNTTAYMKEVDKSGVQVQYDFKFMRTHGVYRASDDVLWLIEVSAGRGVLAMPLPVFPDSRKSSFRDKAVSRGDNAMVKALDELGCLPTGESFPNGETLKAKIAAGDVLQLLTAVEMREFYKLSGYSSVCGWAFSERGNEAHNVGYYYPDDSNVQRGEWFQLNISIGALGLFRRKGDPIATGSANLALQSAGNLYSPAKGGYIPVKYYEPLLPGLLSHSAKPLGATVGQPTCDTVVFVAFMNGDLKTARYFRPKGEKPNVSVSDSRSPGECLLDGEWTWKTTTGSSSLPTMPYTNNIDEREVLEDYVDETTLVSVPLGFDPPQYFDLIESPETCYLYRNKVYRQTTVNEKRGGETRGACFIVPGYSREAYYFFGGHYYNGGRSGSTIVQYANVQDPNAGYGWRKIPRINPPPFPAGAGCSTENCGGKHTERRIVCTVRETALYSGPWVVGFPADCRSYADSGPWMSQCDDVLSHYSAAPIRTDTSSFWSMGRDFEGSWNFFSSGLFGPAKGAITENDYEYAMTPSPDPETELVQFLFATHSGIGDDCVIYTKGFPSPTDSGWTIVGYAPTTITYGDGMPLFIGVNQP